MADDGVEVAKKVEASSQPEYPETTFRSFLEQAPPDTCVRIIDFEVGSAAHYMKTPEVLLFCASSECDGPRMFRSSDSLLTGSGWDQKFLKFVCRNCGKRLYRFAVSYSVSLAPTKDSVGKGLAMKLGQIPAFGPQTPARLLRLVEPDRVLFLQGRRAENRGLGIGAFAYYRRVVENQRNRIIGQIARAVKVVGSTPEVDAIFKEASNQFQFSKSIEMLKDFIPQALLISGENPLALLHSALSKGLHNPEMTDEHCLELAQSIRVVLTELAERVSNVTKDDKEILDALKVLKALPRGSKLPSENPSEKSIVEPTTGQTTAEQATTEEAMAEEIANGESATEAERRVRNAI